MVCSEESPPVKRDLTDKCNFRPLLLQTHKVFLCLLSLADEVILSRATCYSLSGVHCTKGIVFGVNEELRTRSAVCSDLVFNHSSS